MLSVLNLIRIVLIALQQEKSLFENFVRLVIRFDLFSWAPYFQTIALLTPLS